VRTLKNAHKNTSIVVNCGTNVRSNAAKYSPNFLETKPSVPYTFLKMTAKARREAQRRGKNSTPTLEKKYVHDAFTLRLPSLCGQNQNEKVYGTETKAYKNSMTPDRISACIRESIAVKERLAAECLPAIEQCGRVLAQALRSGGKILFCGNGGSAADSQHLAAELVVRLRSSVNRAAIPAIALTVDASIMTAGGNDLGFENVFARCVEAYGRKGDVLVGISTSGNSPNVLQALHQATKQDLRTICLLGGTGGSILGACEASVVVPSSVTARIQESHILIGHIWCEMIEELLFPELFSNATPM